MCLMCLAIWSSRPQLQVGIGTTSFIFLIMWAVSQLWPVSNLVTITCCHQPVKEVDVVPLSVLPQGCFDEGLFLLEGDTVVMLS